MTLEPGTRLGPYEIVSLLSEGGMGEVYRAQDARLNRAVAIKVIHERLAGGPNAFHRFELEAKSAGMLNHPNILAIYDIGSHDGAPYIVSELLEGESLHTRLTRGAVGPQKAIEYALQIASGLSAAHAKGIIHRDLKPANVFVTKDSRIKLLDFGLAKLAEPTTAGATFVETRPGLTEAGVILGTASYMSPEQVRGQPADARTDIFSFGAVMFEMLTGRKAFEAPSAIETMNAALTFEPDMSDVSQRLPPGLELLVRHCLEKNADDRFQSARDLAFQLSTLGGGGLSTSRSAMAALPVVSKAAPSRRGVIAASVLALAAIAGAFAIGQRMATRPLPSYHQLTFRRGAVMTARFSPDGGTAVYGAEWEGRPVQMFSSRFDSPESSALSLPAGDVLAISSSGELAVSLGRHYTVGFSSRGTLARAPLGGGAAREILTDVVAADWAPDGRSLAAVHIVQGKHRLEYPIGTVLYETDGWISHPRFAPDGNSIAFADHPIYGDDRGGVSVITIATKQIARLLTGWASVNGLAWTPSGSEVWFTASEVGGMCELYASTLAGRRRLVTRTAGRLTLQDIYRDGRVLLTQGRVRIGMAFRAGGNGEERDMSWLDAGVAASLTPDGSTLLFNEQGTGGGATGYMVYTRKTDGAAAIKLGEGHLASLSPDGRSVLSILLGPQPAIELLPMGPGEPRLLERGPVVDYLSVAWFPDGKRVLFAGKEAGRGVRTYVQDVSGGPPRAISAEGVRPMRYTDPVSLDGSRIAVFDGEERLALLPVGGGEAQPLEGVEPGDVPIRWHSDGRSLLLYHRGGLPVRVFRLDTITRKQETIAQLYPSDPAGVRNIATVQLTADGRFFGYSYSQALSDLYLVDDLH